MEKQIVVIGAGGIGCEAASAFAEKHSAGAALLPLLFDTDESTKRHLPDAKIFSLTCEETFDAVLARLGGKISRWFPAAAGEEGGFPPFGAEWNMNCGSGAFRMKAMVAFADFLSDERKEALDAMLSAIPENSECLVLTVASVAGGTGSALFLPLTLYVARALSGKNIRAEFCALLSLPGALPFSGTNLQKTKAGGNAYAALRELNAVVTGSGKEAGFLIGAARDPIFGTLYPMQTDEFAHGRLFRRVYLVGKTPGVLRRAEHTAQLGELLFSLSAGVLPTSAPAKGETPFAAVSLSCLMLPQKEIGKYLSARTVAERTEGLICAFRRMRENSEAEKQTWNTEKKKDRNAKKEAAPVVKNKYLTEICRHAAELPLKEPPETPQELTEKLQAGNFPHRFGEGKKTADAKKAGLLKLVKEWYSVQKSYAAGGAAALCDAVLDLRKKWRTPGTPESLFAATGFDGRVTEASFAALCALSEELEKYLNGRITDPRFRMREGEGAEEYLQRMAYLPLPERCEPRFDVPERGQRITKKVCRALEERIFAGFPAVEETFAERRQFAALMLLRADFEKLSGIYENWSRAAKEAVRERKDDTCMRRGPISFGYTVTAGDDPDEKERWYSEYGPYLSEQCVCPAEAAGKQLSAFAGELAREEEAPGTAAFGAAVRAGIDATENAVREWFAGSEGAARLAEKGIFGILFEKDPAALPALLGRTAGRAEPVMDYAAPDPEQPLHRWSRLLFSPGTAKLLAEQPQARGKRLSGSDGTETETFPERGGEESAASAGGETRALRDFLIAGRCLGAEPALCEGLSPFRILGIGCVENLSLSGMAELAETAGNGWYSCYCKCGFLAKKYGTPAWLPDISSGRRAALPYLDKKTEERRLECTARAFLSLFVTENLISQKNGQGEEALYLMQAGVPVPATAGGVPVLTGDFTLMWNFLAENEWLAYSGADAFDTWLDGICGALPQLDENTVSAESFAAAAEKTPFLRALGGAALNGLPMTLSGTLNGQCNGRASRAEAFRRVLNAVADAVTEPYARRAACLAPDLIGSLAARAVGTLEGKLEKPLILFLKKRIGERYPAGRKNAEKHR